MKKPGYNSAYTPPGTFFLRGEEADWTSLFKPKDPSSPVPEVQVAEVPEAGDSTAQRRINVSGPSGTPDGILSARWKIVEFTEQMAPYWWVEFSKVWYYATVYGLTEGQWIFGEEKTIFGRPSNTNHDNKQSDSRDAIQRFEVDKRHPPSIPPTLGQSEIIGGYEEDKPIGSKETFQNGRNTD
jgi:hypothetical protein